MPENRLRKKYRDKFRKKLNVRAAQIPWFENEEDYIKLFNRMVYEEQQIDAYAEALMKAGLLPNELDLALSKIDELLKKLKYTGVTDEDESLKNLYNKIKSTNKDLLRRMLRNATPQSIEAIEDILRYLYDDAESDGESTGYKKKETGIMVLRRVLSGGEIPSMDEAYSMAGNI